MINEDEIEAFIEPDNGRVIRIPEFSVSEISIALKNIVENTFYKIKVKGEISGLKKHNSGHYYFNLKDDKALINAVCWRGTSSDVTALLEDGMEVVCTGKISTYMGRSQYQLIVDNIETSGIGALLKLLEERKQKLAAEGLFDASRKKKIPFLPEVIGVITSPTGAVIRDIMHRLDERFPRKVILWGVAVQGETAASEISSAIKGFNNIDESSKLPKPDVLIVARGGGSLEDLWAFNEEIVVRATAESSIPIISAVGHETDTTLIDFASDLRAPTPTGAAEKAVPVRLELISILSELKMRKFNSLLRLFNDKSAMLNNIFKRLPNVSRLTSEYVQRLDFAIERFLNSFKFGFEKKSQKFIDLSIRLENCSLNQILKRGFSIIKNIKGELVPTKKEAEKNDNLEINFYDGTVKVLTNNKSIKPIKNKKEGIQDDNKNPQGNLF